MTAPNPPPSIGSEALAKPSAMFLMSAPTKGEEIAQMLYDEGCISNKKFHKVAALLDAALESSTLSTDGGVVEAEIRIKELEDLKVMVSIEFQQMRAFDDEMGEDDVLHIIDSRIASLKSETKSTPADTSKAREEGV